MPIRETAAVLRAASDGLLYTSETDSPWAVLDWSAAEGEPTADAVRKRGRHKPDAPAAEQSPEQFFTPLTTDQDWYGDEEKATAARYRQLRDTVRRVLGDPKVIRIGEVRVAVYVIGLAPEGGWAGLRTTAVET
jgi:hypothetical protein